MKLLVTENFVHRVLDRDRGSACAWGKMSHCSQEVLPRGISRLTTVPLHVAFFLHPLRNHFPRGEF